MVNALWLMKDERKPSRAYENLRGLAEAWNTLLHGVLWIACRPPYPPFSRRAVRLKATIAPQWLPAPQAPGLASRGHFCGGATKRRR
jgi:hypothetical protein